MNPIIEAVKANFDLSQNIPLKQAFYEALRKTIILSQIPAGSRINEKEFSTELNISRTPIRHAISRLIDEKLVVQTPKKGTIVKGISAKDAVEIFDIRKALDTLATTKAMNKMTESDFAEMEALLNACNDLINDDNNIEKILANFNQFNNMIYEKSQMLRLREIVTELQTYLVYFREISISSLKRRKRALEEHWIIYRSMKNRDVDQITLITHEHLNHSLDFILKEMDNQSHD
ncbi:GntR family transcriptional regulator [Streptococcus ovuberis]|uniref:GntR family transcriptional regulator n=1 Tax=Streptococcus ovuberis TaxID=1936207 RepID=A0A7X6MZE1_9STRE|nr:GntR family transcriptional regulator [Streptococcus ovuberis]NKZ20661.1 GntR family transcriptional regulator [Streptococcus ovuberis]